MRYDGSRAEAEKALLTVFHITNKGIAHFTEDFNDHPEHATLVEIASRGIPSLVVPPRDLVIWRIRHSAGLRI